MFKFFVLFTLLIFLCQSIYADEIKEVKKTEIPDHKTAEQNSYEKQEFSPAAPVEKFEYNTCAGDEKVKGCKIDDLIKEKDKKSN